MPAFAVAHPLTAMHDHRSSLAQSLALFGSAGDPGDGLQALIFGLHFGLHGASQADGGRPLRRVSWPPGEFDVDIHQAERTLVP